LWRSTADGAYTGRFGGNCPTKMHGRPACVANARRRATSGPRSSTTASMRRSWHDLVRIYGGLIVRRTLPQTGIARVKRQAIRADRFNSSQWRKKGKFSGTLGWMRTAKEKFRAFAYGERKANEGTSARRRLCGRLLRAHGAHWSPCGCAGNGCGSHRLRSRTKRGRLIAAGYCCRVITR